ncbi:MAG: FAD-dependent oxidoreductase, partial [Chloroflexaceae bacterium]|nr:FAD-dependent oxidoreductase [Chloroflexaceae bacterium]
MTTAGWAKLGQIIAAAEQRKHVYEVVIVGAGLSGLMAAYALRDRDILVLEREPRAGGRILTRSAHGVSYDLGAIFGYNQQVLPFDPGPTTLIRESEQIGVCWQGQVFYGTSVMECLSKLNLSNQDRDAIRRFCEDPAHTTHTLPEPIYVLLEAFFQIIHPGDMREYLSQRQLDAFQKFSMAHYQSGNGVLIEQFKQRLGPKLRVDTEVLSVSDETGRVRVVVNHQGKHEALLARSVIVTTPAMVTLKLLTSMSDHCRAFLRSVQYRGGTVIAVGVRGGKLADFSCIVTPDEPTSTIIQHHTGDPNIQVLLVYYAGKKATALEPLPKRRSMNAPRGTAAAPALRNWNRQVALC